MLQWNVETRWRGIYHTWYCHKGWITLKLQKGEMELEKWMEPLRIKATAPHLRTVQNRKPNHSYPDVNVESLIWRSSYNFLSFHSLAPVIFMHLNHTCFTLWWCRMVNCIIPDAWSLLEIHCQNWIRIEDGAHRCRRSLCYTNQLILYFSLNKGSLVTLHLHFNVHLICGRKARSIPLWGGHSVNVLQVCVKNLKIDFLAL